MTDTLKSGAVLFAKDLPRLAAFYQALLPASVVHADADVVVLDGPALHLVLHAIPKRIAKTIVIADPPERREGVPVKLIFAVASIDEARRKAAPLGGVVDPPKKAWEARGFRACDGHDPEGNVIQFREAVVG